MLYIMAILLFFYITVLLRLTIGLFRLKPGQNDSKPGVSIIVAARNEETNIGECLDSLTKQNYDPSRYEIIIVDDRSTDRTAEIVESIIKEHINVKLVRIHESPLEIAPKKNALQSGINIASGDILLMTDADCFPGPEWVTSMVHCFVPDVGLVAGFSPLSRAEKQTLFTRLVRLDSLALASVAAGSFGAKIPLTCSGRNLAYRKSLYDQVGGYGEIGHLISGDDDLFLHLAKRKTDYKYSYAIESGSIVPSNAVTGIRAFINQRVRHASKGMQYSTGMIIGLAAVYLMNAAILFTGIASFLDSHLFIPFIATLLIKSMFEFILLYKASLVFSSVQWLRYFPIAEILHIPYVVIFGLYGQLGKFRWKDNSFSAKLNVPTGTEG